MQKRDFIQRVFEYLYVLLLVLSCNTMYSNEINGKFYISELLTISLFLLIIVSLITNKLDKKKFGWFFVYIVIYFFYILLFILLNKVSLFYNFIRLFIFIFPMTFMYIYCHKDRKVTKNLSNKIVNIVFVISIVSLFFHIAGPILNILKPTGYIDIMWGKQLSRPSYFNLHFYTQTEYIFGFSFIRNTGVFTEAPMYSLVLSIALAFEKFITRRNRKIINCILLVTIFSTLSTTGIIVSLFICLYHYMETNSNKKILKILLIPILMVFFTYIGISFFNQKVGTLSYNARIDDYIASYKAWKDSPIIGNGFKNSESIQYYMNANRRYNMGLSNSILVVLAQNGIYLFLFYLIPFIRTIKCGIKTKQNELIGFAISIFILFCTTIFMYLPITLLLIAMGYSITYDRKDIYENK